MKTVLNIFPRAVKMSRQMGAVLLIAAFGVPMSAHAHMAPSFDRPFAGLAESGIESETLFSDNSILAVERLSQRTISASEAKAIALKKYRGAEVVDITREGGTYRVRLIRKDGRVVDVFIDAQTGRIRN